MKDLGFVLRTKDVPAEMHVSKLFFLFQWQSCESVTVQGDAQPDALEFEAFKCVLNFTLPSVTSKSQSASLFFFLVVKSHAFFKINLILDQGAGSCPLDFPPEVFFSKINIPLDPAITAEPVPVFVCFV